jgi:hypothetical protein
MVHESAVDIINPSEFMILEIVQHTLINDALTPSH